MRKKKKDKWPCTPIYMVWARSEKSNGPYDLENVDLRAVDTDRGLAEIHKKMILVEARTIRPDITAVWIEERVSNHCYGQRDVRLAFRGLVSDGVEWVKERDRD